MLLAITSCLPRLKILGETLKDLSETDWEFPILITMDHEAIELKGLNERFPDERSNVNFRLAIERCVATKVAWFVLLEDDSELNINFQHNLCNWEPLKDRSIGLGGLSTNDKNRHSLIEGTNWYIPDSNLVYGLQGVVMTHEFAVMCLDQWDRYSLNVDLKLAKLAGENIVGSYYKYWPSLVRHRHEVPSLCNHRTVFTEGFDKYFKA